MSEPPPYLSPSSAASFDGCPRRWKFKYLDRLPEPPGEAAVVGTFAHRVLEHLCGLPAAHRTQDQAKALARELWPDVESEPEFQHLALDADRARSFRWKAWLAIVGLWQLEDPAHVDVVHTEQKVRATLDGVPFVGIVDRVERERDRLVVTDFKSGTLPRLRYRGDKIQQVMLYAAALQATGEDPHRARLHYLGQRTIEVPVTPRRLEDARSKLRTTWDGIQAALAADTYEAKPSVLCGWCPFVGDCAEGTAEIERRRAEGTLPAHAPAAGAAA